MGGLDVVGDSGGQAILGCQEDGGALGGGDGADDHGVGEVFSGGDEGGVSGAEGFGNQGGRLIPGGPANPG